MKQEAVLFGPDKSLSGIVTYPEKPLRGVPPLIFLTAGVIHRAGPNGLYSRLCRHLAAEGFTTLRFDFSGIGDSLPRTDQELFSTSSILESKAAMDLMSQLTGARQFVMVGLCSGAYAAIKTAGADPRVAGAIAINTQTLQDGSQDEFQKFASNRSIARHLMNPRTWLKVFDGTARFKGKLPILLSQVTGIFKRKQFSESARAIVDELRTLTERQVNLLFIFSKGDPGLEYFRLLGEREIQRLQATGRLGVELISGTDHIFAPPDAFRKLQKACIAWLAGNYPAVQASGAERLEFSGGAAPGSRAERREPAVRF